MSLVANMAGLALQGLIRIYQLLVAPVLPAHCRYAPSCSAYALEALRRHGAARGGVMALGRILRCHPWGDHGYDPVPTAAQPIRRPR